MIKLEINKLSEEIALLAIIRIRLVKSVLEDDPAPLIVRVNKMKARLDREVTSIRRLMREFEIRLVDINEYGEFN